VVALTRKARLLVEFTRNDIVTKDRAVGRHTQKKRNMRPIFDVLFLLTVLGITISVYQFCPGQHMF
jgi:hypothetical protein